MTIIPAEVRCHRNKQSTFLQDRWVFNPPDVLLRHWLARTDRESVSVQAYLLKNDENKALKPAALQEELNNMLKFNPDFAEAVRFMKLTSYINRCVGGGSLLHQLCGFHSLLSITWTTWTAWGSRTSSCRLTASYIISTDSSCLETRGRVTGTRATAGASATLLSTWPACTVASDTSEYKNYLDTFLLYKAQIIQQLSLPSVSRRTWLCRRRSASPRSPTTTCACSTVW